MALIAPHLFLRFIGLSFLIPGVAAPSLPAAFALPAAWGDFVAGVLAIIATLALTARASWAIAIVWLFNVWGATDLLFFGIPRRNGADHSRTARCCVLHPDCDRASATRNARTYIFGHYSTSRKCKRIRSLVRRLAGRKNPKIATRSIAV